MWERKKTAMVMKWVITKSSFAKYKQRQRQNKPQTDYCWFWISTLSRYEAKNSWCIYRTNNIITTIQTVTLTFVYLYEQRVLFRYASYFSFWYLTLGVYRKAIFFAEAMMLRVTVSVHNYLNVWMCECVCVWMLCIAISRCIPIVIWRWEKKAHVESESTYTPIHRNVSQRYRFQYPKPSHLYIHKLTLCIAVASLFFIPFISMYFDILSVVW